MSAFDGTIKTPLAVANPGTDQKLPSAGSLSYGAITSQTALSGTNGVDACLVKGNEWQHFTSNYTEFIDGNYDLTVKGNRQEMIKTNQKLTVVGKTNHTFVDIFNHTNIAPSNYTYAHTQTQTHAQPSHKQQPTSHTQHENALLEYVHEHTEINWYKGSIVALNLDVTGILKFQWASLYAQYWIWRNKQGAIGEVLITPLRAKLKAVNAKINWAQVAAAMASMNGIPLDVQAGIDANVFVIPPGI